MEGPEGGTSAPAKPKPSSSSRNKLAWGALKKALVPTPSGSDKGATPSVGSTSSSTRFEFRALADLLGVTAREGTVQEALQGSSVGGEGELVTQLAQLCLQQPVASPQDAGKIPLHLYSFASSSTSPSPSFVTVPVLPDQDRSKLSVKDRVKGLLSHRQPVTVAAATAAGRAGSEAAADKAAEAVGVPAQQLLSTRGVDSTGVVRTWQTEEILAALLLQLCHCSRCSSRRHAGAGGSSSCAGQACFFASLSVAELGAGKAGLASRALAHFLMSREAAGSAGGETDKGETSKGAPESAAQSFLPTTRLLLTDGNAEAAGGLAKHLALDSLLLTLQTQSSGKSSTVSGGTGCAVAQTAASAVQLESDCLVWDIPAAMQRQRQRAGRKDRGEAEGKGAEGEAEDAHGEPAAERGRGGFPFYSPSPLHCQLSLGAGVTAEKDASSPSPSPSPSSASPPHPGYDHSFHLVLAADTLFFEDFHWDQLHVIYALLKRTGEGRETAGGESAGAAAAPTGVQAASVPASASAAVSRASFLTATPAAAPQTSAAIAASVEVWEECAPILQATITAASMTAGASGDCRTEAVADSSPSSAPASLASFPHPLQQPQAWLLAPCRSGSLQRFVEKAQQFTVPFKKLSSRAEGSDREGSTAIEKAPAESAAAVESDSSSPSSSPAVILFKPFSVSLHAAFDTSLTAAHEQLQEKGPARTAKRGAAAGAGTETGTGGALSSTSSSSSTLSSLAAAPLSPPQYDPDIHLPLLVRLELQPLPEQLQHALIH